MGCSFVTNVSVEMDKTRILVTGASGFIGSFMVSHALQQGFETWAAVRSTSSRAYLADDRIRFIELDYTDECALYAQLRCHKMKRGRWDIVIHCAGATRCLKSEEYDEANYRATRRLVDVLTALQMIPRQFIFISTLGIYGPLHEQLPFTPIKENDVPRPNTSYGASKRKAEEYLMQLQDFPYVIFRPTGVYGPRDKDYQLLIDSIRHRHAELLLGYRCQRITFVYVRDLVQAVFLAIEQRVHRRCFLVTDGNTYTATDFGRTVCHATHTTFVARLTFPLWVGYVVATLFDAVGRMTGRSFVLNRDKYHILMQRNWTCDITPTIMELGYVPRYNLERGIREMLGCLA